MAEKKKKKPKSEIILTAYISKRKGKRKNKKRKKKYRKIINPNSSLFYANLIFYVFKSSMVATKIQFCLKELRLLAKLKVLTIALN